MDERLQALIQVILDERYDKPATEEESQLLQQLATMPREDMVDKVCEIFSKPYSHGWPPIDETVKAFICPFCVRKGEYYSAFPVAKREPWHTAWICWYHHAIVHIFCVRIVGEALK